MTLEKNREIWGSTYDWSRRGEEWSDAWGGSEAQWTWAILPRIHRFLPTGTILEIAPGYGRWTRFLVPLSAHLIGVDIAQRAVDHCRSQWPTRTFLVGDGMTLAGVPDASVDFIFSFDSLVHAEADVMESYALEFARVLAPGGAGFIHHSNCGELDDSKYRYLRAPSMTVALFSGFCRTAGLWCASQEIVAWGEGGMIDCFSTFRRGTGLTRIVRNEDFMLEAELARRASRLYVGGLVA